jgi:DNA-binding transcriptional ArsR family regulator
VNRRRADADIFSAIAHPIRREILDVLSDGDRPVFALAERFRVSVPAISQHLAVLRAASLVGEHRAGRRRIYRLKPDPLREVSRWLARYERVWSQRLQALGEFLARHAEADKPEPRARRKARK